MALCRRGIHSPCVASTFKARLCVSKHSDSCTDTFLSHNLPGELCGVGLWAAKGDALMTVFRGGNREDEEEAKTSVIRVVQFYVNIF